MSYPGKVVQAYDFESLTVTGSASGLTSTKIAPSGKQAAFEVLITVETNPIRFRTDGTDPTTSVGHLLNAGDAVTITGLNNVRRLKLIATGSNATVMVTFFV